MAPLLTESPNVNILNAPQFFFPLKEWVPAEISKAGTVLPVLPLRKQKLSEGKQLACFDILPSALGGIRQVNENKHGRSGINLHITPRGTEL